jgi:hypothetical protein
LAAFAHVVDTDNLDLAYEMVASIDRHGFNQGFQIPLPVELALAMHGAAQHPGYPLMLMAARPCS